MLFPETGIKTLSFGGLSGGSLKGALGELTITGIDKLKGAAGVKLQAK